MPDWIVRIDPAATEWELSPALLGHYDLSGSLYQFDQQPGLAEAMELVGFSDWRVGLGRWESASLMLPELTDGTSCPFPIPEAFASAGTTDLDILEARDWFVDNGLPVSVADTLNDDRYALSYIRSVLDVAANFGAQPFVSIDHMPRALSANRTPERTDCAWSSMNKVSNVRPEDPEVFAAAARGMVQRVVEGSGGQPGRAVTHWEVWNEPEFAYFWDPSFETGLDRYFEMAILTLVHLEEYSNSSSHPDAKNLRFGFGSFAEADTAVAAIEALDAAPLNDGTHVPFDFVSFHAYYDDPLAVVAKIESVAAARSASSNYADIELVLAEWGPDLGTSASDPLFNSSMEAALHPATVVALGATAGLDRAHRAIFWAYFDGMGFGLLDHALGRRPAYHAYVLLHGLIGSNRFRLLPTAPSDGRLDNGMAALLGSIDEAGVVRLLFVNRGTEARETVVEIGTTETVPSKVEVFDDPAGGIEEKAPSTTFEIPPKSIVLVELPSGETE